MMPDDEGASLNQMGMDVLKATLLDIRELVDDHHQSLRHEGMSQELTDSMTLQLHAHLIHLAFQR